MLNKKKFQPYRVLVYAALIIFAVSIVIPVLWVIMASLKSEAELMSGNPFALPDAIVWENYINAWTKANMGEYIVNSFQVTFTALAMLLVIALPAAYVLARFKFWGRKFINGLFMAGLFINTNYIALSIYMLFFNLEQQTGNNSIFINNKTALALIYAATALPFTVYLLRSSFATIPSEYEEAAAIDGSGYFHTMIRVMFPMAKGSIITVVMFQFLGFWNEYILAFYFLDKDHATLPVGLRYLMGGARSQSETGVMYAGLVLAMLPVIILFLLVRDRMVEGLSGGGIKG